MMLCTGLEGLHASLSSVAIREPTPPYPNPNANNSVPLTVILTIYKYNPDLSPNPSPNANPILLNLRKVSRTKLAR